MKLIPSCTEVHAGLTDYLEGSLPFRKRLGIRLHLFLCHACEGLLKALEALPGLSQRLLAAPLQPPPEAERALDAALKRLKTSGGAASPEGGRRD
jgi:hypothetical protein